MSEYSMFSCKISYGFFPTAFLMLPRIVSVFTVSSNHSFKLYVLGQIVLPLVMPTVSVLFVFFFIWTWNDFFLALVMLVSEKIQTLPLGVLHMQGQYRTTITLQSAGAFLLSLPCIIFFLIFQRTLTKGITASGLKG